MPSDAHATVAIVVTYHPNLPCLFRLLDCLVHQVSWVVVIDNGSPDIDQRLLLDICSKERVSLFLLPDNQGIAAAQNIGIDFARQKNASRVVLFDQDSEPSETMISELERSLTTLEEQGLPVGLVAPVYKNADSRMTSGAVKVGWFGFKRASCSDKERVLEADFAIASGSLIPMSVLDAIGDMDAGLFIDHVDTEWCFRARSRGYRLFNACGAEMTHRLGDHYSKVWLLRWRHISHHAPFRYYYVFRNSVDLQRRKYMPLRWKIANTIRCVGLFVIFGIIGERRRECLRMMFLGVKDGVNRVKGRLLLQ